jgi:hypothetical protein
MRTPTRLFAAAPLRRAGPARLAMLARTVLAAALLAAAACGGDDDDPAGPAAISGTYTLRTVDGNAVPATFTDGSGNVLRFDSGALTLNDGGTYTGALGVTFNSAPFDLEDEGTFTRTGNTLTFASTIDADNDFTATISGTTITAVDYSVASAPFDLVLRK